MKRKRVQPPQGIGVGEGAVLAMIFEKPSTRTRVSFDVAMRQLGGNSIVLNQRDMQLGRGETIADTARVLSRYVDAIMLRTGPHETLTRACRACHRAGDQRADRPLPPLPGHGRCHDLRGEEGRRSKARMVAWIGDGNNVATSWVHAAARFGFRLNIAAPKDFAPSPELLAWAKREGAESRGERGPARGGARAPIAW